MIKNLLSIFFVAILNLSAICQQNDLVGFEKFLGGEKIEALNMLEASFDEFLETNFSNLPTQVKKIKRLLKVVKETGDLDSNWKFNSTFNIQVIQKLEDSGLRKEFWIYGYEKYTPFYYHQFLIDSIKNINPDTNLHFDSNALVKQYSIEEEIIPIINSTDSVDGITYEEWSDSLVEFNWRGQFMFALKKFSSNDTVIDEYVDAKEAAGNISPSLIASGILYRNSDLTEPLIKRVILMEIYYGMINWDNKRKKTTR